MLNRETIRQRLWRKNLTSLGSGMFSDVFQSRDPDRVVKVGRDQDTWPEYILWAWQNGHLGTFAPMVYSFREQDGCYIAVLERLHKLPQEQEVYRMIDNIMHATLPAPYCDFCKALNSFRADKGLNYDIGYSNVMMRTNGEVVITDPVHGRARNRTNTSALGGLARAKPSRPANVRLPSWRGLIDHETLERELSDMALAP